MINLKDVVMESIAYQDPPHQMSTSELEKQLDLLYQRLKLPNGRLELQSGIKNRGYWDLGTKPSFIASLAAGKLIGGSLKNFDDIGLLINASVCRDFMEPATASVVHYQLGLNDKVMSFDLSNACLGMMSAILVASPMIQSGQIKKALIVSGENSAPLLLATMKKLNEDHSLSRNDIKKFMASLTIGSAGVAFVLSHRSLVTTASHSPMINLQYAVQGCDSFGSTLCQGDGNLEQLSMETKAEELLQIGCALAKKTWAEFLVESKKLDHRYLKFIGHQVGSIHRQTIIDQLGLHEMQDFNTFAQYGNTGSAALFLTLAKMQETKCLEPGERLAMLGIGSGVNTIMMGVQG